MKRILLFVLLYCITTSFLFSQSIGIEKLHVFGNQGWDIVTSIDSDNDGNYYVAGSFTGQIDIDGNTLSSSGQRDIFIIKLDSLNTVQWAKQYGGVGDDHAHSISCGVNNHIYLSGSFSETLNLTEEFVASGATDGFIAQLDANGNAQWSKTIKSNSAIRKLLIKTATSNNLYLAGSFNKNLILNDTTEINAQSGDDAFYAKYDMNGNLLHYT